MKRWLSLFLCLTLIVGLVPVAIGVQATESIYWQDDFEDGLGEWEKVRDGSAVWTDTAPYTYISLTEKAYAGEQSFGITQAGKQVLIRKNFGEQMNKVLSVWFYDDTSVIDTRVVACMEVDDNSRLALGLHAATTTKNYAWWDTVTGYSDTGITRSPGWHQFTWDARSGSGIDVYIDGVKIKTDTLYTGFAQITLGWFTAAANTTNAFDSVMISEVLPWELPAESDAEDSTYFFFDPLVIDSTNNVTTATLQLGEVSKTTTDAGWLDQYAWETGGEIPDWEHRVTIMYPYVLYDENGVSVDGKSSAKYKIWYESYYAASPVAGYDWRENLIDATNSKNVELDGAENAARGTVYTSDSPMVMCYMESNDGVHWTRPDCGEFYYKTQDGEIIDTNIVFIGYHGTGVTLNEHPNAGKGEPKFLMCGVASGLGIMWSNDGIHWSTPVIIKDGNATDPRIYGDTHNQLFWSPENEQYVVISRGYDGALRTVLQLSGTEALTSIKDAYNYGYSLWSDPQVVIPGVAGAEPYSVPVVHAYDGYYIGIVSVADFTDDGVGRLRSVHAELVWSRDTVNWYYINGGTPFIPNADNFVLEPGNDYGMIYSAAAVNTKEETQFFYAATPELHYFNFSQVPDEIKAVMATDIPKAYAANAITRTTTMNIASVARDHYAGYYAKDGLVTTAPFLVTGNNLKLTADVKAGGSLLVEVVDENGNVIDGYAASDCASVGQNIIKGSLTWANGKTLADLVGQTVSFRLYLADATVYTIGGGIKLTTPPVTVTADTESIAVKEGATAQIAVSTEPEGTYTFTYTSQDETVATVDENGVVTGLIVGCTTVRAAVAGVVNCYVDIPVTVMPAYSVYWYDDFEDGLGKWEKVRDGSAVWTDTAPYTYISLTETTYAGEQSFGIKQAGKQVLIRKNFGEQMNKVLSVWFYDDTLVTDARVVACMEVDDTSRLALGLHAETTTKNYAWWDTVTGYSDTGIARSPGWHQFTWDARSGSGIDVYIDGVKIKTEKLYTGFAQITLGWFTAAANTTNAFDNVMISEELPWEMSKVLEYDAQEMVSVSSTGYVRFGNDTTANGIFTTRDDTNYNNNTKTKGYAHIRRYTASESGTLIIDTEYTKGIYNGTTESHDAYPMQYAIVDKNGKIVFPASGELGTASYNNRVSISQDNPLKLDVKAGDTYDFIMIDNYGLGVPMYFQARIFMNEGTEVLNYRKNDFVDGCLLAGKNMNQQGEDGWQYLYAESVELVTKMTVVKKGRVVGNGTLTFTAGTVENGESLSTLPAGSIVTVNATPAEGYLLVPGSLTYTTASGVTKRILNKNLQAEDFGNGTGYSYQFVMPEEAVTINAEFQDASQNSVAFDTLGAAYHKTNGVYDGIRFLTRVSFDKFDTSKDDITVTYGGKTYTVVKMGVLLKRATTGAELTLENFANSNVNTASARIWNGVAYDKSVSSKLSVVDYTETSLDLQVRIMKGDSTSAEAFKNYQFSARGYMVLEDATGAQTVIYTGSTVTRSVADIVG